MSAARGSVIRRRAGLFVGWCTARGHATTHSLSRSSGQAALRLPSAPTPRAWWIQEWLSLNRVPRIRTIPPQDRTFRRVADLGGRRGPPPCLI